MITYFSLDIGEMISNWWTSVVENVFWRILWWIEIAVCKLVAQMEDVMMIFTGEIPVKYNEKSDSLIKVFFTHDSVRGIYGGMALIGIVFAFVFAIVSVVRKVMDLRDKQQGVTLGAILGNLIKSIMIICCMNLIMVVSLDITDTLIKQIGVAVTNGGNIAKGSNSITFTDEQFAAMGRIFNTIGNYSLNPSYRSRYNLNACYNDIRGDLEYLDKQGVFNYHYVTYVDPEDPSKGLEPTWQSLLEELAKSNDFHNEAPLDSYEDARMSAMLDVMEEMKKNPNLKVLPSYTRDVQINTKAVPMDRVLFVIGTMGNFNGGAAARIKEFNINPKMDDILRQPFYTGESSIYDYDQVRKSFDPSPMKTNYILVYATGMSVLMEMLVIIVTCSVRIFNLLTLYLASPLVVSAIPLDDGGKLKQWTTAFVVQLLGVVGMVLAMRVFLMFLPIIWSPQLVVSEYDLLSIIIKCIITYGAITAVSRVNGILTGILADSAGWQAISAGDMRSNVAGSAAGKMLGSMSASNIGSKIAGLGKSAASATVGKIGGAAWDQTGGRLGKAIYGSTVGKLYSKISGKDINTGEKTAAQQTKESRQRGRQMKDLQQNIKHARATGKTLDGKKAKPNDIKRMQHTYNHMKKDNMSLDDAKSAANQDMKEDRKDAQHSAANRLGALKNPPPGKNEDLPG